MKGTRFTFLQRVYIRVTCRLAWMLVWLINSTSRLQVEGLRNLEESASQGGVIFSFWHNQIFSWSYVARFRDIVVMTSRHFDGEYIARMIQLFGFRAARGSSTRGGVAALLELKDCLSNGTDVAFSIDGPRGPVYKVKPGPIWLSQKTGFPVLPVHVQPQRYWELSSWDRFRIPKPFSNVLVQFGEPIHVPPDADQDLWLPGFQEGMDRLSSSAENFDWSHFQANWDVTKNRSYRYRTGGGEV